MAMDDVPNRLAEIAVQMGQLQNVIPEQRKLLKLLFEESLNNGTCKERSAPFRYQRALRRFGGEAASAAGGARSHNCSFSTQSPGILE